MGIKYLIDEQYFESWSPEMAYILGFLYADGSLENAPKLRGKYVRATSTDLEVIKHIKKSLRSEHRIIIIPSFRKRKERYLFRAGSHVLFDSLTQHGLFPNKSLSMKFPKNIPSNYLSHFIRGYFDGDGCVHLSQARNREGALLVKRLGVVFTSGSELFLKELEREIRNVLNIKKRNIYKSRRSFQLRYSTTDSIELFTLIYANTKNLFYLGRKKEIFLRYFKLRPQRINTNIGKMLKNM
tara:strand:+ start:10060 stop:10779 length:720 start_codon:yes stop_codon:yes gene_type:complete